MVKEGHIQKTIVMPVVLEDRLIAYVRERNDAERARKIPKRQQTDASTVICTALDKYLAKHGH